eukprot:COSAG05_NODE_1147_length_5730_cov_3.054520_8_plen_56_part_00
MLALVDDRGVERKMVLAVSVWAALAAEEQAPRCRRFLVADSTLPASHTQQHNIAL